MKEHAIQDCSVKQQGSKLLAARVKESPSECLVCGSDMYLNRGRTVFAKFKTEKGTPGQGGQRT